MKLNESVETLKIKKLRDDPVILLGMHHSGTSILAEVLHRNGIFMQANMHHHESKFFTRDINDRLILGDSSRWAELPIMPVEEVMAKLNEVRRAIEKKAFQKYVAAGYDGVSCWGFKDPRTCITLPLFLEIFSNARLLHILRNEDDVAASLSASNKQGIGVNVDRDHWKTLRRQYEQRVEDYGRKHRHFLELHYEDFCQRPLEVMANVFEFLNVPFLPQTKEFLQKHIYTHRIGVA